MPKSRLLSPVAALLLGAALLAACSGANHHSSPTTGPTTSTTVAATNSAIPPGPASPYVWQRSASRALDIGGGASTTLATVMAPQDSAPWEVFGTVTRPAGASTATEWTSPDTKTWARVALASSAGSSQALAAATYRGRTVVVGSTGTGQSRRAAVWVSAQVGAPFHEESVPASAGPASMTEVASGTLGIYAIGEVNGQFALWSSSNGSDWSEQPTAERSIESAPATRVNTILAFDNSVYLGGSVQPGPNQEAALWTTSDGIHWHTVSDKQTSFAGGSSDVINSLSLLGTGMVAVGGTETSNGWTPASWISPDGISWSPPSTDFPGTRTRTDASSWADNAASGAGTTLSAVSPITTSVGPTSVVAAGDGSDGQGAWTSDDGLHWKSLALPEEKTAATSWSPGAIAATQTSTVVVGTAPGRPYVLSGSGTQWRQPSADPKVFGAVTPYVSATTLDAYDGKLSLTADLVDPPQSISATHSGTTSVKTFTSTNGREWTAAKSNAPPPLPASSDVVARTTSAWIAVGPAPDHTIGVWASTGHGRWKRAGEISANATSTATVLGVCVSPTSSGSSRLVAVGAAKTTTRSPSSAAATTTTTSAIDPVPPATSDGSNAVAWTSRTGSSWQEATVLHAQASGAHESMSGCTSIAPSTTASPASSSSSGSGPSPTSGTSPGSAQGTAPSASPQEFVAYGTGSSPSGSPEPGLWESTDGLAWTRVSGQAFAAGTPNTATDLPSSLVSLAASGNDWLAVAATSTQTPGGVWMSTDAGTQWQLLDTSTAPWTSQQETDFDGSAFIGSTAVVAGISDGRLAVWDGTDTAAASGSSPTS